MLQETENLLHNLKQRYQPDKLSTDDQIFSTEQERQASSEYFLNSAEQISHFFEEDVFDADGKLRFEFEKCINKLGHSIHNLNHVFEKFTSGYAPLRDILESLGYKAPVLLQSMLIFKQPGIGGAVRAHQDSTFLYTDPPSTVGFWIPLENATIENGCLNVIPGSHRKYAVRKKFVRNPDYFEHGTGLSVPKRDSKHSGTKALIFEEDKSIAEHQYDESDFIPVEMKAGSLLVFDGALVHKSEKNTSKKRRLAYTFHCIEGKEAGYFYEKSNWLQMKQFIPCFNKFAEI